MGQNNQTPSIQHATHFLKDGNAYRVFPHSALDIKPALPVGNYVVKQDPRTMDYFLEKVDGFEGESVVYGDIASRVERVFASYQDRPRTTGVLLTGEKGSGKTMMARLLALRAAQEGMPCLLINQPHHGDTFNQFMQTIQQPCVVMFDEFEKVYSSEDQDAVLTLLDGVFQSKKLFVLTCNDKWCLAGPMRNRPGRLLYSIEFNGVSEAFVRDYCAKNMKNTAHVDELVDVMYLFEEFNFDMLKSLVEEMNRFGESPKEAMRLLNIKPEQSDDKLYTVVSLKVEGKEVSSKMRSGSRWHGNPTSEMIQLYWAVNNTDQNDDEEDGRVEFMPVDLELLDMRKGLFTFKNSEGAVLVLQHQNEKMTSKLLDFKTPSPY